MMFHERTRARSTLRALLIASGVALGVGGALLGASLARAEPAAAAAPAFASDRLSVEVIGQGPDVVLIPGLASSREVWRPTAERLAATHRVHLVQLAGFAGEPWRHGDGPLLRPAVEELARYLREQDLEGAAVIGHSLGGAAGLMLAQDHPGLAGRVMTVDSLPFFGAMYGPTATPESVRPAAEAMAAAMLAMDEAAFASVQTRTAATLARDPATRERIVAWSLASDRRAVATAMGEVMTTDRRPGLADVSAPVWAVYAADDQGGAPAAMAEELWTREYAGLPGVTLVRVDGARHFVMADRPAAFAAAVDRFLAE